MFCLGSFSQGICKINKGSLERGCFLPLRVRFEAFEVVWNKQSAAKRIEESGRGFKEGVRENTSSRGL